jgi:predicted methyltransferase
MNRTIRIFSAAAVLGLGLAPCIAGAAQASRKQINAAIADPARPAADVARDAARKPAELVRFAGIGPGSRISELLPGGGYFTRIFSKVVGPTGMVYALVPERPANAPAQMPDFAAPINALMSTPGYGNIRMIMLAGTPTSPVDPVDIAWTSLNYHDLHNRPNADLNAFNQRIYDALKHGGIYIVIDHAAEAGSGARDTKTLHRIDPAQVRKEVEAVGFRLVAESKVLRNKKDTHTVGVIDPSIRGQTDQFVYKFRKP